MVESSFIVEDVKISLTETEEKIFNVIKKIISDHKLTTIVRVAGGWVRDKIMGNESDDIDITLDNMAGKDFADLIMEEFKGADPSQFAHIHVVGVTASHLATAAVRIFGMVIDIVTTRKEKYTEKTLMPQVEAGTPEDDAFRRDFTFNTLFYNINGGYVEDYTRKGISDLRLGLVRTPCEPFTFSIHF